MQELPDFQIDELVVEEDRPAHIARHDEVSVEEVLEVINSSDYVTVETKQGRIMLIGESSRGRFLAIVVGPRATPGIYGLITARPAHRSERALYSKLTGGQING